MPNGLGRSEHPQFPVFLVSRLGGTKLGGVLFLGIKGKNLRVHRSITRFSVEIFVSFGMYTYIDYKAIIISFVWLLILTRAHLALLLLDPTGKACKTYNTASPGQFSLLILLLHTVRKRWGEGTATVKSQCQVSTVDRTALAANSINSILRRKRGTSNFIR